VVIQLTVGLEFFCFLHIRMHSNSIRSYGSCGKNPSTFQIMENSNNSEIIIHDYHMLFVFKRRNHGDLDWFMYELRWMNSVLWKDKMPVLLLSIQVLHVFTKDP
jgi:hypothetical protein